MHFWSYPGRDRSPISGPYRSWQWCCTTVYHLHGPQLCRSHTRHPEIQTGSGRALPQNFRLLQQCLAKQRHNNIINKTLVAAPNFVYTLWFLSLTTIGTESIFLIDVKVVCGGTPAVTITAALCGTAVILVSQKDKGKNTLFPICVSSKGEQDCHKKNSLYEFLRLRNLHNNTSIRPDRNTELSFSSYHKWSNLRSLGQKPNFLSLL